MASVPDHHNLNGAHRETLSLIFRHPSSHNIEWPAVLSLLEAVGEVKERHDGKYLVTIGAHTQTFERPPHKDIDLQMLGDLRKLLRGAGYEPPSDT
jgi:hypothetical protein